jgi:hypothetical protein
VVRVFTDFRQVGDVGNETSEIFKMSVFRQDQLSLTTILVELSYNLSNVNLIR